MKCMQHFFPSGLAPVLGICDFWCTLPCRLMRTSSSYKNPSIRSIAKAERVSHVPSPNSPHRKGLVTLEQFLGSMGTWLNHNVIQSILWLLHIDMQWDPNRRAAFWLVGAKLRQLTLYNIVARPDAMSHENHRAAIWLAYTVDLEIFVW